MPPVRIANLELHENMELTPHHFLRPTLSAFRVLAAIASAAFKSRAALQLENLALRHQLGVLNPLGEAAETDLSRSTPQGVAMQGFGAIGNLPWSSSSRKQSLPGIEKVSGCSGLGKLVTASLAGRWSRKICEN